MKMRLNSLKQHSLLVFSLVFFVVGIVIRSWSISSIPAFVVSDEIQYISEARSLILSGHDLTGVWTPWSLTSSHGWYAELPGVILMPAVILFWNQPMLAAKATHIFMGAIIPLLLAGIAYSLFKNKQLSIWVLLVACFNPWFFQFSRLAFESYFSVFFYLVGIFLYLRFTDWKKLLAILPFFIGFFQYQGHKLLLLPFIAILFVYSLTAYWPYKKISFIKTIVLEKYSLVVLLFAILLTAIFILRLPSQAAGTRITQMTFMNQSALASQVNVERRLSLSNSFEPLFVNKATVLFDDMISKYFGSFNLVYLFSGGANASDSWAVTSHGKFFALDIVLFIFGIAMISVKKYRSGVLLILFLLLVSPLPAVVAQGQIWATFRTAFIIPFSLIIIGLGMWWFQNIMSKKMFVVFLGLYVLAMLPFYYDYFYRYPIYSTSDVYFYNRVVANYLKRIDGQSDTRKTLFLSDEKRHLYITLLFYNGWLNTDSYPSISDTTQKGVYRYKNIEVRENCLDEKLLSEHPLLLSQRHMGYCADTDDSSFEGVNRLTIPSLVDSGEVIKIYGDTFCSQYQLNTFSAVKENSFNLESLSDEEFCQTFFIQYK
jgi:hypothetical protein